MKLFLLISAIIEIIAGLALFLIPGKAAKLGADQPAGLTFSNMYGAAALAVGFLGLQAWQNTDNIGFIQAFLLSFIIFHIGVMMATYKGTTRGMKEMLPAVILHAVLAVASIYFFMQVR